MLSPVITKKIANEDFPIRADNPFGLIPLEFQGLEILPSKPPPFEDESAYKTADNGRDGLLREKRVRKLRIATTP